MSSKSLVHSWSAASTVFQPSQPTELFLPRWLQYRPTAQPGEVADKGSLPVHAPRPILPEPPSLSHEQWVEPRPEGELDEARPVEETHRQRPSPFVGYLIVAAQESRAAPRRRCKVTLNRHLRGKPRATGYCPTQRVPSFYVQPPHPPLPPRPVRAPPKRCRTYDKKSSCRPARWLRPSPSAAAASSPSQLFLPLKKITNIYKKIDQPQQRLAGRISGLGRTTGRGGAGV